MASVTFQIIEGLERGRIFSDLPTPVTIGREEDNTISLKDEQVSRLHAKLQEEEGKVILTDVSSTNGTRVNGHPVQMRVLQIGDLLSIGRCLLVYGSPEEIAAQVEHSEDADPKSSDSAEQTLAVIFDDVSHADSGSFRTNGIMQSRELFPHGPPDPPQNLRPLQKAEISDFLAYLHAEFGDMLRTLKEDPSSKKRKKKPIQLDWSTWQRLLKLEMDLAVYMRKIAEPGNEESEDAP
ncbi:MAG: FHA domain-containing protein [Planctomycetes bacterium]|nr:FHA domain-containing protein [Planctomycetota bacterium]